MSEVTLKTTDVTSNNSSVEVQNTRAVTTSAPCEAKVNVNKKEYAVVGDALFASVNTNEAPQWLTGIIDNTISSSLSSSLSSLETANRNIETAISEIQVAKNQYQELINIDATIDRAIASKLTTLNSTLDNNRADIDTIQTTYVDADRAAAIADDRILASLNNGELAASVNTLTTAITSTNNTLAANVQALNADYQGLSSAHSALVSTVETNAEKADANFAYNATVSINGVSYRTGFGLATSINSSGIPFGTSEFWVKADKFRFVDTHGNVMLKGDNTGIAFNNAGAIKSDYYSLQSRVGVFLGYNNGYQFLAGNGYSYIHYDGNAVKVKGQITMVDSYLQSTGLSTFNVSQHPGYSGTVVDSDGLKVYNNGVLRVKIGRIA